MERRTAFVKHIPKSSTTKHDISLGNEGKAVPTRNANPVVLALSRHDSKIRVSDVISRSGVTNESGNSRE